MVGKVTLGLALHWPCVTDFSGLSTLSIIKVSEENQGALGVGARGQGRLSESSGSSNDI